MSDEVLVWLSEGRCRWFADHLCYVKRR